jgi:pyruvate dehydrogenase E1 component alpha subunit
MTSAYTDLLGPWTQAPVNAQLSGAEQVRLYTEMLRIRCFEEQSVRAYQQGKIGGFCHTYIGQEAVAVGTLSVLGPDDHIITGYRDHGHALAVGMGMNELMAELYGKATGCSKGKGGSMHYFDPKRNFWGGHGIVGGQTPLGLGIAYALKYQGKKGACLCYLGDGAVNQGAFYESLNMAGLWQVPVIYIIENNGYSMGTSQARSSCGETLWGRASGFGIAAQSVAGHNLFEVRAKTLEALERAYAQHTPSVLEISTYRYRGHSMSDPDKSYRSKEEIQTYKSQQDPIRLLEGYLFEKGFLSPEDSQALEAQARQEASAAAQFAQESPFPSLEDLYEDIYTESPKARSTHGTLIFDNN